MAEVERAVRLKNLRGTSSLEKGPLARCVCSGLPSGELRRRPSLFIRGDSMKTALMALILVLPLFASADLVKPVLDCTNVSTGGKGEPCIIATVTYLTQNRAYVMTVEQLRFGNTVPWPTSRQGDQSHERVTLRKSMSFGEPTSFAGKTYALSVNLSAMPVGGAYPGVLTRIATGQSIPIVCRAK